MNKPANTKPTAINRFRFIREASLSVYSALITATMVEGRALLFSNMDRELLLLYNIMKLCKPDNCAIMPEPIKRKPGVGNPPGLFEMMF